MSTGDQPGRDPGLGGTRTGVTVEGAMRPRTRRRHRWVRRTALTVSVLVPFALAAPASADSFGLDQPNNNVPGVGAIPDNFDHTFCFSGVGWTANWKDLVSSRMQNLDTQTLYFDNPVPNGACQNPTDLHFKLDTTLPNGTRGSWGCRLWENGADGLPNSGDDRCSAANIKINPNPGVLVDNHQRRKTICHEIGHSVGMMDGTNTATYWNDCMVSGTVAAGNQWEQYNSHHRTHANSRTPAP